MAVLAVIIGGLATATVVALSGGLALAIAYLF